MPDTQNDRPAGPGRWRIAWVVVLSLLTPGLGQVYARAWGPALLLIAVNEALALATRAATYATGPTPSALGLAAILVAASLALFIGAAIDAARRLRFRSSEPRPRWFRSTWFAAILLVGFGLTVDEALPFGWRSFSIPSGSMIPTLLVGDRFLADTRRPGATPSRGDVVLFTLPKDPSTTYVKRVIGLPGDRIAVRRGVLFINGAPVPRWPLGPTAADPGRRFTETLPEGRVYTTLHLTDDGRANNTTEFHVPPDSLFVMGDNRDNSLDSRFDQLGAIPLRNVIGVAGALFWSPVRSRMFSVVE